MVILKSPEEIKLMREAGKIVAECHQLASSLITAGITTGEIDQKVEQLIQRHGAIPLFKGVPGVVPFPAVTCISVNEEVVHGIPGDRILEEGDIVSVDVGCKINGWCGDAAWTYAVGKIDQQKQKVMEVGQKTLEVAIAELDQHQSWFGVAAIMEKTVLDAGLFIVEDFVGHGIGQEMHEDPQVPNFVSSNRAGDDFLLPIGIVLAIEPMVTCGTSEVLVLDDHWTVVTEDDQPSVHFEHTVALSENGPIILTEGVGQ